MGVDRVDLLLFLPNWTSTERLVLNNGCTITSKARLPKCKICYRTSCKEVDGNLHCKHSATNKSSFSRPVASHCKHKSHDEC